MSWISKVGIFVQCMSKYAKESTHQMSDNFAITASAELVIR